MNSKDANNIQFRKDEIISKKVVLLDLLDDFSRSQKELWQQVPALAKKVNKFKNFTLGRFQMAHDCFLWPISPQFLHGLQVDLRTGTLQSGGADSSLETVQLGQISTILEQLDAARVIQQLRGEILVLLSKQQSSHDLGRAHDIDE